MVDNRLFIGPGSGVEPGLRDHRRDMQRVGFRVRILGEKTARIAEGFGVALLHVTEAAKLALHTVEIAVTVPIS